MYCMLQISLSFINNVIKITFRILSKVKYGVKHRENCVVTVVTAEKSLELNSLNLTCGLFICYEQARY